MSVNEALQIYGQALRAGQKCYHDRVSRGEYPYLQVLDEILDERFIAGKVEIGSAEIPADRIVGTKTAGRRNAFAANFMPLLPADSEFGAKWIMLCDADLTEEGFHDPIKVYEYLGRFFVLEGNKRVSVMKSFGAETMPAVVTRVVPEWSDSAEIRLYYEFLDFYRLSHSYQFFFSRPGSYQRFQAALGFDEDHVWTDEEQKSLRAAKAVFSAGLSQLRYDRSAVNDSDIFLTLLQVYRLEEIKEMSPQKLQTAISGIIPDAEALTAERPINVNTEPEPESKGLINRIIGAVTLPGHLNIAFINDRPPETSDWVRGHDRGREYLESVMGDRVTVRTYIGGSDAGAFDLAAEEGAQVVFATTPSLINACRKAAANHPSLKIFNCSVSMPFPGVRTYYSRIYEGKFISGAVAGAMTKTGRIGYIANNPIYGTPAGINAFALGARMTCPDVQIILRWTGTDVNTFEELKDEGCDLLSHTDIPAPSHDPRDFGLLSVGQDGSLVPVMSPVWNWGEFYVKMVRSIFSGSWDALSYRAQGAAVNFWWGISGGAVDLVYGENIPRSMQELAEMLKTDIASGAVAPFHRYIKASDGRVMNDGNAWLSPEEILHMDWLCECVSGRIPEYEELLPIARPIVRLLGIHREDIPPEKDAPQI